MPYSLKPIWAWPLRRTFHFSQAWIITHLETGALKRKDNRQTKNVQKSPTILFRIFQYLFRRKSGFLCVMCKASSIIFYDDHAHSGSMMVQSWCIMDCFQITDRHFWRKMLPRKSVWVLIDFPPALPCRITTSLGFLCPEAPGSHPGSSFSNGCWCALIKIALRVAEPQCQIHHSQIELIWTHDWTSTDF